ncbi:VOC family protein [Ideonella alba]|nr:VOC family protein [Ideonella alba]
MLRAVESVIFFVADIDAAAAWWADLLGSTVGHENPQFAFVRGPGGVVLGFHPADAKCPGGIGGTTVYWEVDDLDVAVQELQRRGARLHRGPMRTDFGAGVAMMVCPWGCTVGLNRVTEESCQAITATGNFGGS